MRNHRKCLVRLVTPNSLAGVALLLALLVAVPVAAAQVPGTSQPPTVVKFSDRDLCCFDEPVVFTITVACPPGPPDGQNLATWYDVRVTDVIDPDFEIVNVEVTPPADDVNMSGNTVVVTVNSLAPGEFFMVRITVRLTAGADLGGVILNQATVQFKDEAGVEQEVQASDMVDVNVCDEVPFVPEASTFVLLGSAVSALAGYAGLQIRSRHYRAR
jgi:fimbrial isopeptide formation D2 family protein